MSDVVVAESTTSDNASSTSPVGVEQRAAAYARRKRVATVFGYLAMVVVVLLVALPLVWILLASFKDRSEIYVQPAVWWPSVWHPENYREATTSVPFWDFMRNSLIVTSILGVVKFALGVLSAYGLVFYGFRSRTWCSS